MAERRKTVGQSARFGVFERDGFACQYCGLKPPEAILEIDHIVPVSKNGTNEQENLLTSCKTCNRGKGARDLKTSSPDRVRKNAGDIKERYDQLVAFYKFQKKMSSLKASAIDDIAEHWDNLWDGRYPLGKMERNSIGLFLRHFSPEEVKEAISLAMGRIRFPSDAFKYMCGVLHTRKRERNGQE